ncbi:MAG: dethiobiotin synthase [Sulfurimicrobium sp.]|nr:dethiobiotin synthase [Sulfurimicrobium sp.]MDP1703386.1 dethiobiotin synthase [Sulfurimicrobium sp.]MDP2200161.1 dethiobiotin synthase [Sulfurimicrobium sp.]MDP3689074.1 dethiobiotin synthase [Sulfurimicrobium sp.]
MTLIPSPRGVFVTGTDTDVGKTLISCALLHAWRNAGKTALGMKPVAAGCEQQAQGMVCGDVVALRRASSTQAPIEWVNPYAFAPPIAPHVAAEVAGVAIDLERIREAFLALAGSAEIVVVEGAGGFKVPLNSNQDSADLARQLGLPIVLVVGMRLGCLNHALLTAEAIRAQGLTLAGWVANRIDPEMAYFGSNLDALQQRLGAPLLGVVEHEAGPDPVRVAQRLNLPNI